VGATILEESFIIADDDETPGRDGDAIEQEWREGDGGVPLSETGFLHEEGRAF